MHLHEILHLDRIELERAIAEQNRTLRKLLSDDPDFARLTALYPDLMP